MLIPIVHLQIVVVSLWSGWS